jgi:hypothetical protein
VIVAIGTPVDEYLNPAALAARLFETLRPYSIPHDDRHRSARAPTPWSRAARSAPTATTGWSPLPERIAILRRARAAAAADRVGLHQRRRTRRRRCSADRAEDPAVVLEEAELASCSRTALHSVAAANQFYMVR